MPITFIPNNKHSTGNINQKKKYKKYKKYKKKKKNSALHLGKV